MTLIVPAIMAGGTGTRLWPLSRKAKPKQYRSLVTERTMFDETLARLDAIEGDVADAMVISNAAHVEEIRGIARANGHTLGPIVLEPFGRNTAPVAVIASALAQEKSPDALVLLLPSDHHIGDPAAFAKSVATAAKAAQEGRLVTFGIAPDRPETGYGYIRRGEALFADAYNVEAFVEKPDLETAEKYLSEGVYSWNAGIFLFRADVMLEEAKRHCPDIYEAALASLTTAERDGGSVTLSAEAFNKVPDDSIDYAIMERTEKAALVGPVSMGWNDIGSWFSVRDLSAREDQASDGGDIYMSDCEGTYVRTDGPFVATIGLKDVIVVATGDAVLVVDAARAQDVKSVIAEIKARKRDDLL